MMLPNGWKKVKLGEICNKIGSGSTPKGGRDVYLNAGIPIIRSQNVLNGFLDLNDVAFISDEQHSKMKGTWVHPNDILLNITGASIGRSCVVPATMKTANVNQHVCIIRLKECADACYVCNLILSKDVQKQIELLSVGGGRQGLNFQQIASFSFLLPPLEEQKKIAATLSVWDSAIEKMEKLIEAKEISFNSLLKELIYAPAEKECWNIVKLGDVSEMSSGGTPKSSVEKYYNGDVLWVSIADMTEQGMYIKDTAKKLTKLGVENSAAKIYPKGTVLYAMYASIGEVSIAEKEMASSQAILGIQVSDKLVNKYLYYFLVGQKERIKLQGQAGTQSNLNAGMVKNLDIPIPSIKEQNKIIAVLDNGMDELSLLKQQLENYKKQKQGSMQKLLTGQWRVK